MRDRSDIVLRAGMLAALLLPGAAPATDPSDGHGDYLHYCAACHGPGGHGADAAALEPTPGDLTTLAAANGGSFPETYVYRVIDGREMLDGHGTRAMPVWGNRFAADGATAIEVEQRIDALLRFIESLQVDFVDDP